MVIILKESENFPFTCNGLPKNYNFELNKTLKTIKKLKPKTISFQFPDGLICYAPLLIDTIKMYFDVDCYVLNDVVYGACCIDDSFQSDLLIHYGHSCLIPITETDIRVLYIFVDIKIDLEHLYNLILSNFKETVAIIGTIQFNSSVNRLKNLIKNKCVVPKIKPLSPGEVLGCTSPILKGVDSVIYLADGRFHLESVMIQNPTLNFYKYCPFTKKLTREYYDFEKMIKIRKAEILKFRKSKNIGIILGTLGRQGNTQILKNLENYLKKEHCIYKILSDEINEETLDSYEFIDAFVQISCPRLSIDWGASYKKPLLSPFEVFYDFKEYKMDYYSNEGHAPWKNYNNKL